MIIKSLALDVERDTDGTYVVSDSVFNVYGVGNSEEASLQDYMVSLAEFHELIKASAVNNLYDLPMLSKLQSCISMEHEG